MKPSELSFDTICDFLDAIANILKDPKVKKKYTERAKMTKGFMNHSIDRLSGEAFEVFRLIMPKLDTERGNYRLKEAALGAVFADAMNLKDTPKAKPLLEWTDPTVNATVAGNLSAIVEKVVAETARIPNDAPIELRKTMKVSDVNEKLDELVRTSGKRKDQANVLTYFVRNGTPRQCRYITQIILKNMKHGCGDKPFFDCWHPDAASYFDTHGMSIKSVFNNLKDDKPVIFSITPGKVVNPQLACTTFSAQSAIQKLQKYEKEKFGKDAPEGEDFKFLIETKFDGERIQVHRTGNEVQYFSRKAIDHGVRNKYTLLDEVILAATGGRILEEELAVEQGNNNNGKKAASRLDCVLDGELIVWNKRKQNFEAFGTLKSVFHAAEEGKPPDTALVIDDWGGIVDFSSSKYKALLDDQLNGGGGGGGVTAPPSLSTQNGCTQNTRIKSHTAMLLAPTLSDCELMYIPFDILYCQHAEKIKFPLSERHRLLKETVKASSIKVPGISGVVCRVEPLIPEETCFNEGVYASRFASTAEEIQEAIVTVRNRGEEGIVIKALDSEWKPNNRSNHWLKIKPDYLYTQEIDAVVLGGWYSSSDKRTCDGIAKYLMGLVKKPEHEGEDVTTFVTFCRVATGLTEEQRAYVNEKLKDLYVADPSAKPACVISSGPRSEQPDVWVKNPFDSLVFQLHADLRLISSVNYASQVSLRFPRIQFIREDRNARSANVDETLLETAMNKYREIVQVEAEETSPDGKKRKKGGGDGARKRNKVIASNRAEKLAAVQAKTDVFKGRTIYIYPPPSKNFSFKGNLASWREVVKELGGKVALNNAGSQVTDVVAVTLNDPIVQSFMKKHSSKTILTPEWILHCKEEGMLCPLRPRDFLYMAPDDEKRPSREEADVFGDYYFQDSEVEDVVALFQHHSKAKDLDINEIIRSLLDVESSAAAVTFANGFASTIKLEEYTDVTNKRISLRYSARTLLGWIDSELAAVGKLNRRTSILHGCTILLLEIPGNGTRTSTISGSGNLGSGSGGGLVTLAQTKGVEVATMGATAAARRARCTD